MSCFPLRTSGLSKVRLPEPWAGGGKQGEGDEGKERKKGSGKRGGRREKKGQETGGGGRKRREMKED